MVRSAEAARALIQLRRAKLGRKELQQPGGSRLHRCVRLLGEGDEMVDCRPVRRQRLSDTQKGIRMLAVELLELRFQLKIGAMVFTIRNDT